MDLFKNLVVNLKARGPAAVLIAWIFGVVALGVFGHGDIANYALGIMAIFGSAYITALVVMS